jgi:hypothetical protein
MEGKGKVALVATLAAALTLGVVATPAAAKENLVVVPGKRINGIELGDKRSDVRDLKPLNLKKPTTTTVTPLVIGEIRTEIWASEFGHQLAVGYASSKKKGKKKKKKDPKVIFVSTGAGFWYTQDGSLAYDTINGGGTTPAGASGLCPPGSFYQKTPSGQRLYNPDPGDGQVCEVIFDQRTFFYLTFNHIGPTADVPARLAAFTLSRVPLP